MFKSARIKLTLWYLVIIAIITGIFSFGTYQLLTLELRRSLHIQTNRIFPPSGLPFSGDNSPVFFNVRFSNNAPALEFERQVYKEARDRILTRMILVNLAVLGITGVAAYFLAGKTLAPIEIMLEDQKRFVADASHELRTPLTSLKTEIEVALRDQKLKLTDAKSLLKSNLEEVDKMQNVSNYLLDLSRYQNSQLSLPFETVNLTSVINNAFDKVEPLAKDKRLDVERHLAPTVVNGNSASLTELVTILLDNAIKYSRPGGKIILTLTVINKHVTLSVQDFGIGIKAHDLPHIFDRFYRVDASRSKTRIDGFGLGLSIAKTIVELHHGRISASSVSNKGSVFIVTLPVKHENE